MTGVPISKPRRPGPAAVAFLALVLAPTSCGRNRTELILGIITDLPARNAIDHVQLTVTKSGAEGTPIVSQGWDLTDVPEGQYVLPGSFGIYSPDGSAIRIHITIIGYLRCHPGSANSGSCDAGATAETEVIRREAILSLVEGRTIFLRLALEARCLESVIRCGAGLTCIDGYCASPNVDSNSLPAYQQGMESTVQCGNGAAFINSATHQSVTGSGACSKSQTCIEGTCVENTYFAGGTTVDGALLTMDAIPPAGPPDLTARDLAPTPTDAAMPDAAAPDAAMPDLAVPDLVMVDLLVPPPPDGSIPDLTTSDLALPNDLSMSDLQVPPDVLVTPPDVTLPDLARPDATLPDLAMPDFAKPDQAMPDLIKPDLIPPSDFLQPDATGSSWSVQPGPSPTSDYYFVDVSAINFSGPVNSYVVGTQGAIVTSQNGGAFTLSKQGNVTFYAFANLSNGPALSYAAGAAGTLLVSNNGGTSWAPITTFSQKFGAVTITSLWGSSSMDFYATAQSFVAHTTDGGTTWTQVLTATAPLNQLWGTASNNVFAVGVGGGVHHFNGQLWMRLMGPTDDLNAITGDFGGNLFAVGASGAIWTSINNGLNWTKQTSGTTRTLHGVAWVPSTPSTTVVAVGDVGTILQSTDGGKTWPAQASPTYNDLMSVGEADICSNGMTTIVVHAVGKGNVILKNGTFKGSGCG